MSRRPAKCRCSPCTALANRRARAREAALDELGELAAGAPRPTALAMSDAIDSAVETATRVQITPEMVNEYQKAAMAGGANVAIIAVFRAAGFEVED